MSEVILRRRDPLDVIRYVLQEEFLRVRGGTIPAQAEADIRSTLEEVEDARSYAAEIAQGVSHYPHEEAEPCVRCRAERAEAEVGALQQLAEIRLQESMRQEMAKEQAEAEVERLREALRECQRVFDHPAFTDRAGIGDVVRAALRGER